MKNLAFTFPIQLRAIALLTAVALLAWTIGLPVWVQNANAANVSSFSDVSSDTDLGAPSAHRLTFTTDNGISPLNGTIEIEFDSIDGDHDFNFAGFTIGDIDIVSGATQVANVGACGGPADEMYATLGVDTVVLNMCSGHTIASSTTFIVDVGTTTGGNLISNPSVEDSYVISISGTGNFGDYGDTRIAVINDVTVTAAVDTIFTFTINGVATSTSVNDDVVTTADTSTATTVPFGIIQPGVPKLMAQELRVDTNAINGFSVSVFADQTLTAGNGATIDPFIDGTEVASSTLWEKQNPILGSTDTYGHWGLTSDDNVVSSSSPWLWGAGEAAYVGNFIQNPVEVFYNNTPVEYSQGGMGVGSTTVAYKVEITNLQEAAKDYTATLTYIATPVF